MSAKARPTPPPAPEPGRRGKEASRTPASAPRKPPEVQEIGGPPGPEPTRYGDWEKGGRCSDF